MTGAEPPSGPGWSSRPDEHCEQGRTFIYTTGATIDREAFASRLVEACEGRAIRRDEPWGGRRVPRVVVQFEVEYRVGVRDDELILAHRVSAPPATRERSARRLERLLTEQFGPERPASCDSHPEADPDLSA